MVGRRGPGADVIGIERLAVVFGGPWASCGLVGEREGGLVVAGVISIARFQACVRRSEPRDRSPILVRARMSIGGPICAR
jgi:hypothetical protein